MDPAQVLDLECQKTALPIEEATAPGNSEIQNFYRGATIFITGGTGFIGKQLQEKLFRSCEINKMFVLIRQKKGVAMKERLQTMLSDPVFENVRKKKPDIESRIVAVEGDVSELRLGLNDADWETLSDEVTIIFHAAATIRFDEKLRTAALINVRGTREALLLGKACKKLRSFVHVSTAYCHGTSFRVSQEVLEQFYASPIPPSTMINLAETVDESRLDKITSSLISGWPNTYTFTKAIGEELVHAEAGKLPICIVRPSIVLNTYAEPVPGWLDTSCIFGPSGFVFGVGIGVLRVILVDSTSKMSFVPVDFVNNATIAAGWHTAQHDTGEIKIYNISTTNCGVTFRHISVPMRSEKVRCIVSPRTIWYLYLIETNNRFVHKFWAWLVHYIPAYVVDAVIYVFRIKKPPGLKSFSYVYEKIDRLSKVFEFFLRNEWNFDDTNLEKLREKMSPVDKTIYNFNMKSIDWAHFTFLWCLGLRKFMVKDGLVGTEKAIARQKWFKLANHTVWLLYFLIFYKILAWICYLIRCLL